MLDKEQQAEVRQILADVTAKHYAEIKGMLNVMSANLMRIESIGSRTEAHAEKTNGRVTKLEDEVSGLKMADLKHSANCPNAGRIKALEDAEIGRKAVKQFTWKQWLVASAIGGGLILIIQIIIEKL